MKVGIQGVGTSHFGRQPNRTASELVWESASEALEDAGPGRIDAVYVGSVYGEMGVAQRALHPLGLAGVPVVRVENACASGTTALHEAQLAVHHGRYERVLAIGVEHMTSRFSGAIPPERRDPDGRSGLALPALYAMAASRYEALHGVTERQLALVSVKNRQHAAGNERAQFRDPVTVDQVLGSRPIADPIKLLECSPIADGSAAAIVGPVRPEHHDVAITACNLRSGTRWNGESPHVWGYDIVQRTATAAFEAAGLGPSDIDVLEVHDAFTIGEVVTCEALGLAVEGEGIDLVTAGHTWMGGTQPVNPSGGLLARGHPLGATGLAQVAEIVWQLTGRAGARQVEGARIGVVETMGGGVAGVDGNACVIVVLEATG